MPLFWEQTGVQLGAHKIDLCRGVDATLPAQRLHFANLCATYGPKGVHVINLLGKAKTSPEAALSAAFAASVRQHPGVGMTEFDYHAIVKRDSYERVGGRGGRGMRRARPHQTLLIPLAAARALPWPASSRS